MTLETNWESLSGNVHKAISALGKKSGVQAEAFFAGCQTTEVSIRNSEILAQKKVDDLGVGFRVIVKGNKVGFACTNITSSKGVSRAAERAFNIAKVSSEVPHFALPSAGKPSKTRGLFDSRVADIDVGEAVDVARRGIRAAEDFDSRAIAKDGRINFALEFVGILNTLGLDFEERRTRSFIYIGGGGEQNGEVTSSCYEAMFRRTANLDPELVGENVARKVVRLFNPRPMKSFEGPVIFQSEATAYQIVDVLLGALKADNVIAGSSMWAKQTGNPVASDKLTIRDEALLEGGFSSRSFDDEGCPSRDTVLIENGTLRSFLHDATSANALDLENTGNASRSPGGFDMVRTIIGSGYRGKPEIYASNLVIEPGKASTEELVNEVDKGLLVGSMAGFPQAGSGMISAQLSQAFVIEEGAVRYPVKGGMLSGVAFDWLKNISGISKDFKSFQNVVVPSLRIEKLKVVGS